MFDVFCLNVFLGNVISFFIKEYYGGYNLAIMEINGFDKDYIKSKLKLFGNEAFNLLTITDFIFSDCITDLTALLDSEFDSKQGHPAYPSCHVVRYYYVLL